jgi:hypothetical protein
MLKPKSIQSSGCINIHQTSPKRLNKRYLSPRKLMATVLWDRKGALMVEFMQQGTTITSEMLCETLQQLRRAIQYKKHGMLTYGVVLLYDNVIPRKGTAARTLALLEHFNWEFLITLVTVLISF